VSNQGFVGDWVPQAGGMKPAAGNEGAQREGGGKEGASVASPRKGLPMAGDDALCALIVDDIFAAVLPGEFFDPRFCGLQVLRGFHPD
jgi:hypothetical protein